MGTGATPRPPAPGPGRIAQDDARRIGKIAVAVLGIIFLLLFIALNTGTVTVSFVLFEARISLIWVIVLSAVVGSVVGFAVARLIRRRFLSPPAG